MTRRLLVLHGPNLNLLHEGETTLASLDGALARRAQAQGVTLEAVQAQGEAALLDALHARATDLEGVIVNPGALAPQAFALAEALELLELRAVEVLLSVLPAARGVSALDPVVEAEFHGEGAQGYFSALEHLLGEDAEAPGDDEPTTPQGKTLGRARPAGASDEGRPMKTIGRRAPKADAPASPVPGKTLGRAEAPARPSPTGLLTRALVADRLKQRLAGRLAPEALAAWARTEWAALQAQGACEAGQRELLDDALLTLSASAKDSDALLIATLARLDS
jgi:3-dehydroquinate dehydratase-2